MGLDLVYTCGPAELALRFTDSEDFGELVTLAALLAQKGKRWSLH